MPYLPGGEPGTLSRGWTKFQLIRQLAEAEVKRTVLAKEHGVSGRAIANFANRHAREIDQARKAMDDELSLLWVTKKVNRMAEYQQMIDDLTLELEQKLHPEDPDDAVGFMSKDMRDIVKIKGGLLHTVAEELGQLPIRQAGIGDAVTVIHQIVGVAEETDL